MKRLTVSLVLIVGAFSAGSVAFAATGYRVDFSVSSEWLLSGGVTLVQADGSESDNSESDNPAETEEVDEELLAEFLADPEAFIDNPDNAGLIAAVVRQAIANDPANADNIISVAEGKTDPGIIGAIAEGIVQAAADYAAAGNTVASSQILVKVSDSVSGSLGDAVGVRASQIAGLTQSVEEAEVSVPEEPQETEQAETEQTEPAEPGDVAESEAEIIEGTPSEIVETLSDPATEAPSLTEGAAATTTGEDGGGQPTSSPPSSGGGSTPTSSTSDPFGGGAGDDGNVTPTEPEAPASPV